MPAVQQGVDRQKAGIKRSVRNNGKNFESRGGLRYRGDVKDKAVAFQTIITELRRELAVTKMRSAQVVANAHRTREHVQRCRALRRGYTWVPENPPTFVNTRSVHVH